MLNTNGGYCHCGCGQKTTVAKRTNAKRGDIKGMPVKFIVGHFFKTVKPEDRYQWNGGRYKENRGYIRIFMPGHKRSSRNHVLEHIVVIEKKIGRELRKNEVVHHIDENRANNDPENLMVFKDSASHIKHHAKMNAVKNGCPPNYKKCPYCKNYDDPKNMYTRPGGEQSWHRKCRNKHERPNLHND